MIITEANLATQACIYSKTIARQAMKSLTIKLLAGSLMLKLIILTQPLIT
jgi:hypothetical protein